MGFFAAIYAADGQQHELIATSRDTGAVLGAARAMLREAEATADNPDASFAGRARAAGLAEALRAVIADIEQSGWTTTGGGGSTVDA